MWTYWAPCDAPGGRCVLTFYSGLPSRVGLQEVWCDVAGVTQAEVVSGHSGSLALVVSEWGRGCIVLSVRWYVGEAQIHSQE